MSFAEVDDLHPLLANFDVLYNRSIYMIFLLVYIEKLYPERIEYVELQFS